MSAWFLRFETCNIGSHDNDDFALLGESRVAFFFPRFQRETERQRARKRDRQRQTEIEHKLKDRGKVR